MGTTQHQAAHLLRQHRPQVFLRGHPCHRMVQPALLHQRHKKWTRLRVDPHARIERMHSTRVGIAVDRGRRTDHPNTPTGRLRNRRRRPSLDDVDHRNIASTLGYHPRGHGRHGVAGDDQHLDVLLQQEIGDLRGKMLDRGHRLDPIGHPGGIAKIDDILQR
ncbi:hypothetical protein SDC9_163874 [bioreactor metagenome]|uniref:Uncharacterized protein n=1 Tax=bioreactor metagenome TaxID=1076179 RepID=A0A645FRL0_9ZZZZ